MKTSPKRSFSVIQNERFGLVFAKIRPIISGTGEPVRHATPDNPIPTRFRAPADRLKIPALVYGWGGVYTCWGRWHPGVNLTQASLTLSLMLNRAKGDGGREGWRRAYRKLERQVKVLKKNLAIFFLFPSKQYLLISLKNQLLVILCNIWIMNMVINIFTLLEKDLKNVSERKCPLKVLSNGKEGGGCEWYQSVGL